MEATDHVGALDDLTPRAWLLALLTAVNLFCVVFFWRAVITGAGRDTADYFAWAVLPIYAVEIWLAFFIQRRLHAFKYVTSAPWQVVAGGILLNPWFMGWWIPLSVLMSFMRAKGKAPPNRP